MKKLALIALLFMVGNLHAMNNLKDFQAWRGSETIGNEAFVILATACPCVVYDVLVASGSKATQSGFQYFSTTVTLPALFGKQQSKFIISTSTIYNTDTAGTVFDIYEVINSSSVGYTKTGDASIRIRWDYFYAPPKGQERRGKLR